MLQAYTIPLKGLKQGMHEFDYQLNEAFFANFENAPVQQCQLTVHLQIDKRVNLFILQFDIEGAIPVSCDRCTEIFDWSFESNNIVLLKVSYNKDEAEEEDSDTDILYISADRSNYNIAQLIYEFVVLNMPIQKVHPLGENGQALCNAKVLDILNHGIEEEATDDETENIDPRWAALRKLKDK